MNIAVIGGGAAGMMAAGVAAQNGATVTLFEKNEKLGKKLYITGKGRCNVTNDCSRDEFFHNVVSNPKFLFSAYHNFDSKATFAFFEENGCPLKVERGNRVFPESDKSSDIQRALSFFLKKYHVNIVLNSKIDKIVSDNGRVTGIINNNRFYSCDKVILATGGLAYPATGSTGDGYRMAMRLEHHMVEARPALVPLKTSAVEIEGLQGVSLKNVGVCVKHGQQVLATDFGEMIFTHFGVSGPCILTLSSFLTRINLENVELCIDFKPALSVDVLDARLLKDFTKYSNKQLKNALNDLLPRAMIPQIIRASAVDGEKIVNSLTVAERKQLVAVLKDYRLPITGRCDFDEAIITSGGIQVSEVNPKTLESKLVKGLFFAGEILDVDALTGGFNLQIAFSTGFTAGQFASAHDGLL